jgi:hypothetical protein
VPQAAQSPEWVETGGETRGLIFFVLPSDTGMIVRMFLVISSFCTSNVLPDLIDLLTFTHQCLKTKHNCPNYESPCRDKESRYIGLRRKATYIRGRIRYGIFFKCLVVLELFLVSKIRGTVTLIQVKHM